MCGEASTAKCECEEKLSISRTSRLPSSVMEVSTVSYSNVTSRIFVVQDLVYMYVSTYYVQIPSQCCNRAVPLCSYFINVSFIRSYICFYICGLYKGELRHKILGFMVRTILNETFSHPLTWKLHSLELKLKL